jgi:hypothetical protein
LGVLTKTFPLDKVTAVVAAAGKTNRRQRDLHAHVVVYYVIALTLYMQVSYREVLRCLLEGIRWLLGPQGGAVVQAEGHRSGTLINTDFESIVALAVSAWFMRFPEDDGVAIPRAVWIRSVDGVLNRRRAVESCLPNPNSTAYP